MMRPLWLGSKPYQIRKMIEAVHYARKALKINLHEGKYWQAAAFAIINWVIKQRPLMLMKKLFL